MSSARPSSGRPERVGPPMLASGWYALGSAVDFPLGTVRPARIHDRDLVVFRTRSGRINALDAHCPHLGAHLGHGGTVEEETVRCPFHGFRFDGTGTCVATGYGTPAPRTARIEPWYVHEVGGIVLIWADPAGRPPQWEVPDLDTTGWSRWRLRHFTLAGHPQETTENSVDMGHLAAVHEYTDVRMLSPLVTDGPNLQIGYGMSRTRALRGVRLPTVATEFRIDVWGLGWSRVEVTIPRLGVRARLLVLSAQTSTGTVDLRIAASMPVSAACDPSPEGLLRHLPARAVAALGLGPTLRAFAGDVRQDFSIWQHKIYVDPPVLAAGDGPIGPYRRWARQFYAATGAKGALDPRPAPAEKVSVGDG